MTSLDFLYYSLGIAIWAFIALSVYVAVSIVRLLEHIRTITKAAYDTALSVQAVRSGMKLGVYNMIQRMINFFTGGGAVSESTKK